MPRAGITTASDVLEGQNPKEAMNKKLRETKDEGERDVQRKLSTMSGKRSTVMYCPFKIIFTFRTKLK